MNEPATSLGTEPSATTDPPVGNPSPAASADTKGRAKPRSTSTGAAADRLHERELAEERFRRAEEERTKLLEKLIAAHEAPTGSPAVASPALPPEDPVLTRSEKAKSGVVIGIALFIVLAVLIFVVYYAITKITESMGGMSEKAATFSTEVFKTQDTRYQESLVKNEGLHGEIARLTGELERVKAEKAALEAKVAEAEARSVKTAADRAEIDALKAKVSTVAEAQERLNSELAQKKASDEQFKQETRDTLGQIKSAVETRLQPAQSPPAPAAQGTPGSLGGTTTATEPAKKNSSEPTLVNVVVEKSVVTANKDNLVTLFLFKGGSFIGIEPYVDPSSIAVQGEGVKEVVVYVQKGKPSRTKKLPMSNIDGYLRSANSVHGPCTVTLHYSDGSADKHDGGLVALADNGAGGTKVFYTNLERDAKGKILIAQAETPNPTVLRQ